MTSSHELVPFEPSPAAEAAFLTFVKAREAGEGPDLEELCRRHPGMADDLRALHQAWSWLEGASDGPPDRRGTGESRYSLRGELGRGGMGIVFKVWDRELRRHLAMKVCRFSSVAQDEQAPRRRSHYRFLEEAQITAQLDHPGIVPIHELGVDRDGHAYFAMRMVEGRTLNEVLELVGRGVDGWSRTRMLGVLVQVCETLVYAHAKGVVHRDLKPSNIMVGRFGEVYVMDWGLAKVRVREDPTDLRPHREEAAWLEGVSSVRSDELEETPGSPLRTLEGSVLGTPAYMSPEQAAGQLDALGPASDIYSVGAILYHALSASPPYSDEEDIVEAVRTKPPRALYCPDVPPELTAICDKAMARIPEERYGSMADLATDLRSFLEDRVVQAHATGALAEAQKWVSRNRALATSLALVVLLVVAAVGTGSWMQRERIRALDIAHAEKNAEFYAASVSAAAQALRLPDTSGAREHLQACPEELRGWEWSFLESRLDQSVATFGSGSSARTIRYSPDGTRLLAVFTDSADLWTESGAHLATLGAGDSLYCGQFAPDGSLLLGTVRGLDRYDPESFERTESLDLGGTVRTIAVDGAGQRLAHSVDGRIMIRSAPNDEVLADFAASESPIWWLVWSPDGSHLAASARDGMIRVWETRTWTQTLALQVHPHLENWHLDWDVAWSPDGQTLAAGVSPGVILGMHPATGEVLAQIKHPSAWFFGLDYLPDGRLVAVDRDRTLSIVDLELGEIRRFHGHTSLYGVMGLAVHPDGRTVATLGDTIKLWSIDVPHEQIFRSHRWDVQSLNFSPDGKRFVTGSRDGTARVFDMRTGENTLTLAGAGSTRGMAAFGPRGEHLYSTHLGPGLHGQATVWVNDSETGRLVFKMSADAGAQYRIAVDPAGKWVVTMPLEAGDVILWDLETREPAQRFHWEGPHLPQPAFARDGRSVMWGEGHDVKVLELPVTGPPTTLSGNGSQILDLTFSPDGALIATASDDQTARIWSAATHECLAVLRGHSNWVLGVDFSPDGSRLLTTSADSTARLWDPTRARLVHTIPHSSWVIDGCFTPDGSAIATVYANLARIFERDPDPEVLQARADAAALRESMRPRVESLFEEWELKADVVAALQQDTTLTPDELRSATCLARSRAENVFELADAAERVLLSEESSADELARALRKVQVACEQSPDLARLHHQRGLGLHRTGDHRAALQVLREADRMNGESFTSYPRSRDLALIALCLLELGERDEARVALEEAEAIQAADEEAARHITRARRSFSD